MTTRVPFDDDYVKLVGTAVYLFSYYEWAIIYVIERLEPGFVAEYCRGHWSGMTSGQVSKRFMKAVEGYAVGQGRNQRGAAVLLARIRQPSTQPQRTYPRAPNYR